MNRPPLRQPHAGRRSGLSSGCSPTAPKRDSWTSGGIATSHLKSAAQCETSTCNLSSGMPATMSRCRFTWYGVMELRTIANPGRVSLSSSGIWILRRSLWRSSDEACAFEAIYWIVRRLEDHVKSGPAVPARGTRCTTLVCAAGEQHNANRFQQQEDVDPRRPIAYVVGVELNAFVVRCVVSAGNLPQTGDARLHHCVQTIV